MASSNRFSFELNTLHRPADLLGGGGGGIFIYLKGGVEMFLVGCRQHHSVSFGRG